MVPPDSLFGVIPTWVGVYLASIAAFGVAGYFLYQRVFKLVLLGKPADRFDQPVRRLLRRAAVHLRPAQGAAAGIAKRPCGPRPLLHLLGLPFILAKLCPVHLPRLALASALLQDTLRDRLESLHHLPGHSRHPVPPRARVGSDPSLGLHAKPPEVRPHAEERVRHHPRSDSNAYGLHAAHGSVLHRGRRFRIARGRSHRRRIGCRLQRR